MTVIAIVIGSLGKVSPNALESGLEEFEIEGRSESIERRGLLRSVRILSRVLKI